MLTTIFLGIFSVILAYLAKYKHFTWGLKASFTLVFLFLALRYNFGNDYKGYLKAFLKFNTYSNFNFFDNKNHFEPGWIFLNRVFKPLGFFAMTAVLAAFNCIIYYRVIKKYIPIELYWLAVFLYIFSPGFMLTHSSAMRQSIAIGLFIFSIDYLYKKDAIRYFLCIGLASLIHTSALILVPVYLMGFLNWRIKLISGVIIISLFISIFAFQNYFSINLNEFISGYFQKYEIYKGGVKLSSGLGFVYSTILFALILYYARFQQQETDLLFKLSIISFLFIPLSFIILMTGRVAMYFAPATIIVYPILLINIKKPIYKTIFISVLLFMTTNSFFQFFYSDIYKTAFGTYHTIFSAPKFF